MLKREASSQLLLLVKNRFFFGGGGFALLLSLLDPFLFLPVNMVKGVLKAWCLGKERELLHSR